MGLQCWQIAPSKLQSPLIHTERVFGVCACVCAGVLCPIETVPVLITEFGCGVADTLT